jgi:hypothetical protein
MFWRLRALVGYAKLPDGGDNSSKPIQKLPTAYGTKRDAETALGRSRGSDLTRVFADLTRSGASPANVRRAFAVIRRGFAVAVEDGDLRGVNPAAVVKRRLPTVTREDPRPATRDEVTAAITEVETATTPNGRRNGSLRSRRLSRWFLGCPVAQGWRDLVPILPSMYTSSESNRGDLPIPRPPLRDGNRRVAEVQLLMKEIDADIQAWSSIEAVQKVRALRQVAQAELDSITQRSV